MMVESFTVQTFENLGKIEQLSVFMNLQLNGNHSMLTMRNRIWQRAHGFVLHGRVHVLKEEAEVGVTDIGYRDGGESERWFQLRRLWRDFGT